MTASHETLFIGGGWVPPSSAATIEVRNASTGERVGAVPEGAEADIDVAVAAAAWRAFDDPAGWSSWPPSERAAALERLAAELEQRAQEIGRLVSIQNGMPIALSPIIEGLTPVGTLRYMVSLLASAPVEEEAPRFLGGDLVIRHEPIGVIAGIVPWNYPQTLSSYKYAPALAAWPVGRRQVKRPRPRARPRRDRRLPEPQDPLRVTPGNACSADPARHPRGFGDGVSMPSRRTEDLATCRGGRLRHRPQALPVNYATDPDRRCRWRSRQTARPVAGVADRLRPHPAPRTPHPALRTLRLNAAARRDRSA
jgi:aldehyde dehydrogenase family protein